MIVEKDDTLKQREEFLSLVLKKRRNLEHLTGSAGLVIINKSMGATGCVPWYTMEISMLESRMYK
jgi:hypothetical protein